MVQFTSNKTYNWINESDLDRLQKMIGVRSSKKYSFGDTKWKELRNQLNEFRKEEGIYETKNEGGENKIKLKEDLVKLLNEISTKIEKSGTTFKSKTSTGLLLPKQRKWKEKMKEQIKEILEDMEGNEQCRYTKIYLKDLINKNIKETLPNNCICKNKIEKIQSNKRKVNRIKISFLKMEILRENLNFIEIFIYEKDGNKKFNELKKSMEKLGNDIIKTPTNGKIDDKINEFYTELIHLYYKVIEHFINLNFEKNILKKKIKGNLWSNNNISKKIDNIKKIYRILINSYNNLIKLSDNKLYNFKITKELKNLDFIEIINEKFNDRKNEITKTLTERRYKLIGKIEGLQNKVTKLGNDELTNKYTNYKKIMESLNFRELQQVYEDIIKIIQKKEEDKAKAAAAKKTGKKAGKKAENEAGKKAENEAAKGKGKNQKSGGSKTKKRKTKLKKNKKK